MYKLLVILLIPVVMLTGCSYSKIPVNDINQITDLILSKEIKLANRSSNGYKYYMPAGVRLANYMLYNEKLYANKSVYYMYIDVVSFYFNKEVKYEVNEDAYFSKELKHGNKVGYLEINLINDKYFIEMMYNYAKIEAYVDELYIVDSIINLSYILSSIRYNETVIQMLFNDDLLDFNEENFNIFEPKRKEGNFLDYINEYDSYEGNDEDIISSEWITIE